MTKFKNQKPNHNSKPKKPCHSFNNSNKEGWYYLPVKDLSALLRGITSKHDCDFYCLNCLPSFRTKINFVDIKKYAKVKIFVMLGWFLQTVRY